MFKTNPQKQVEWKKAITTWKQSSLSAKEWCKVNEIKYSNFKYWKNRLSDLEALKEPAKFIELSLDNKNPTKEHIEVQVGPVKLTLQRDFDEVTFERLLIILRRSI